jgi:hypothetical protein
MVLMDAIYSGYEKDQADEIVNTFKEEKSVKKRKGRNVN